MAKILIADDEVSLATIVADAVEARGHVPEVVSNGRDALERLRMYTFDLAILDWKMPLLTGVEVVRSYRAEHGTVPILMLTAANTVSDKETALDAGADDYIVKPFDVREVLARVNALLRRPAAFVETSNRTIGNTTLSTSQHSLMIANVPIQLTSTEFNLFELFLRYPDKIFSYDELLDRMFHTEADASVEALRGRIKRLRKKLEDSNSDISVQSVYGVGYRLMPLK